MFKISFKRLAVPFKIYADSEYLLKGVKSSDKNNISYTEKYHDHIPCSFAFKIFCIDNRFSKKAVSYRGEGGARNAVYRFTNAIPKESDY